MICPRVFLSRPALTVKLSRMSAMALRSLGAEA